MLMVRHCVVTGILATLLTGACGRKASDSSAADTSSAESSVIETLSSDSAGSHRASAAAANPVTAPLTREDVQRWERGMEGELKAVQVAGTRMKTAHTGDDSLNAMMGVQEMATAG